MSTIASDQLIAAFARPGTEAALRALAESGALFAALPELRPTVGCTQPKEHHYDVFEHTLHTVGYAEAAASETGPEPLFPPELDRDAYLAERIGTRDRLELLKWAALFHDIAKPQTQTVQPDGRIRFFGHSQLGATVADEVLARFGFQAAERDHVARIVLHHLRPGMLGAWPPTDKALTRFFRDLAGAGVDTLVLNFADHWAQRGPHMTEGEWRAHAREIRWLIAWDYRARRPVPKPVRLITGEDVMRVLGLPPGPAVGEALRAVERQGPTNREEALAYLRALAPAFQRSA